MGRISQLRKQANDNFHMMTIGSYQKREYRKQVVYRFIDSLYASGNVPPNWYKLNSEHIFSVVNHWRKLKLTDESIRRYIGEIRYFLQAINHNIIDIDNKSLGLLRTKDKIKQPFNEDCLQKISDPIVLLMLRLQTECGLTLSEAFRFTPDLHSRVDHLLLSRDITHNSSDRVISLYCESQIETIRLSEKLIECNSNPIKQYGYAGLRERYRHEIKKIGLTPAVNYRYVFAAKRFFNLIQHNPKKTAKEIILREMSISKLTLRRYLNEQDKAEKR